MFVAWVIPEPPNRTEVCGFFYALTKKGRHKMVHSEFIRDTYYYPLESTVHISHIAQHAVAGERHAFSFEEDNSKKTEDRMRGAELARRTSRRNSGNNRTPVISSAAERSREILLCRSIATERKNLTQITQIFTDFSVRRQIMLASERITRNREAELSRRKSRNSGNSRHFERSGAESRNPFMPKHCEER